MISEQQQEQASLYVLGGLPAGELAAFETELRGSTELQDLVRVLQRTTSLLASAAPSVVPPPGLKDKVLKRIEAATLKTNETTEEPQTPYRVISAVSGLRFLNADDQRDWKQLPVPGASIKLLSLERERGYAVLLGKLEAGVQYPAHTNVGPEDFYILTGDLVIGDRKLVAGDFHHADQGSEHQVNYSVGGCTLLAVLTTDDPLVALAMAD
jgi:anti-sigma factor ChrR (cupin superfamily)